MIHCLRFTAFALAQILAVPAARPTHTDTHNIMITSIHKQDDCLTPRMCGNCVLQLLCHPQPGLDAEQLADLAKVIPESRPVKKGQSLFRTGERFQSLFAVRTGFFKTTLANPDGRDQVTGFFMSGELLGLEGIDDGKYRSDAVALEDSEVCELPFANLEGIVAAVPTMATYFYKLMSREIVRDQNLMMLLGNMRAEERLAAFLLNLSQRLQLRGFSATDFILRMSREELGSYLGLKLETVSRTLSRFQQEGWLKVEHKHIRLLQPESLQALVAQPAA